MTSTRSQTPEYSYPVFFQSTAASLSSFFARRPLFSIACSLFSKNTRGGGSVPKCEPSFTHANSIASYHIHVSQAFSCNYALFCATAQRLLHCFQSLAHSFVVDRGWGESNASIAGRKTGGNAEACPLHHSSQLRVSYAPAPLEKLPTASASVLYTSKTVRSLVICRTSWNLLPKWQSFSAAPCVLAL